LSYTLVILDHLDTLVIVDAGLPISAEMVRIDLALTQGVPGADQTLKVKSVILAEEAKNCNHKFPADVQDLLPGVRVEYVTHSEFKIRTTEARPVVRTGEISPYASVILVARVVF
jgi:D-ribose pyranase